MYIKFVCSLIFYIGKIHRNPQKVVCPICSIVLNRVDNMRTHILIHTGEKPHKCTYCDRAYRQKGDLNKHLRVHVGDNIYRCDKCDKGFRLQIDLREHSRVHYKELNDINKEAQTTNIG